MGESDGSESSGEEYDGGDNGEFNEGCGKGYGEEYDEENDEEGDEQDAEENDEQDDVEDDEQDNEEDDEEEDEEEDHTVDHDDPEDQDEVLPEERLTQERLHHESDSTAARRPRRPRGGERVAGRWRGTRATHQGPPSSESSSSGVSHGAGDNAREQNGRYSRHRQRAQRIPAKRQRRRRFLGWAWRYAASCVAGCKRMNGWREWEDVRTEKGR